APPRAGARARRRCAARAPLAPSAMARLRGRGRADRSGSRGGGVTAWARSPATRSRPRRCRGSAATEIRRRSRDDGATSSWLHHESDGENSGMLRGVSQLRALAYADALPAALWAREPLGPLRWLRHRATVTNASALADGPRLRRQYVGVLADNSARIVR